ncbi:Hypothetical predicted protein, partial [Paramuricea clavata]
MAAALYVNFSTFIALFLDLVITWTCGTLCESLNSRSWRIRLGLVCHTIVCHCLRLRVDGSFTLRSVFELLN